MAHDRRLVARMTLTLAAVLVVDLLFVAVVASLLSPWLNAAYWTLASASLAPSRSVWWGAVAAIGLGLAAWAHLHYARQRLLASVDAEPAGPETHPDLHTRLTRLAAKADLPPPSLAVVETDVPNSLAVGGPRSATVVVSEGLVDELDDDQLDAVLAHEVAHVAHRDAAVMTLATFLPALATEEYRPLSDPRPAALGVALVAVYAVGVVVLDPAGGLGSALVAAVAVVVALVFGGVALGVLATPVLLLARQLSRDREFAADRAGATLSGDSAVLVTALEDLGRERPERPSMDLRVTDGVGTLCFLPHGFDGEPGPATRSHPSVAKRVDWLRKLTAGNDSPGER